MVIHSFISFMFNSGNKTHKTTQRDRQYKQTRAMTLNIKTYASKPETQSIDRDNCTTVLDRELRELTAMHN